MRTKTCGIVVVSLLLAAMASVRAQQPKPADKPAEVPSVAGGTVDIGAVEANEGAAKQPGPDVLIAPPPPAKPGPKAAEFARVLAEFKKLEAEAGTIKVKYQAADAPHRAEMRKQFDQLVAKLDVLLDQLIAAAEKAVRRIAQCR